MVILKTVFVYCYIVLAIIVFAEINILWSHHQVHHSADDFNMSVGLRHGILNAWLTWVLKILKYIILIELLSFTLPLRFYTRHLLYLFRLLSS